MTANENRTCPLCGHGGIVDYHRDEVRSYVQCRVCDLVFVPSGQHLSAAAEKVCYDLHDNRPDDPGYRRFLSRMFTPLNQRLAPQSSGLDFGCGPGPALAQMFEEAGHSVALYDPFYAPDKSVLSGQYDFITLTEVIEHLAAPGMELDRLWGCLRPGGWLGVMTKRVIDQDAFRSWHYIRDPTHVGFYSEATFQWLVKRWSTVGSPATLAIVGADVVLFKKGQLAEISVA